MATEKFEIRNRRTGEVQVTAEINCAPDALPSVKLGLAVRWALKERADLRGTDLSDADLSDADLSGTDLRGTDLRGANLSDADLRGTNLSGTNLRDAYLSGTNLRGTNLSDAYLSDAQFRSFKADMWMTLTQNPREVLGLIAALRAGRINGSQYQGACACLVGTIANLAGTPYDTLDHNANNPAELWFAMISEGDKPGDDTGGGYAAQKALDWALEWCRLSGVDPDGVPAVLDAA